MLNAFRKSAETRRIARRLYDQIVTRARAPYFFANLHVADTVDGRFDLVALHAWLALDALRTLGLGDLAQRLTDTLFVGFDEGLREQGAGDMGMGRRVKKLADAFYGRLHAYTSAATEAALAEAILRNVYRGQAQYAEAGRHLARYSLAARSRLADGNAAAGTLDFGPLPGT